MLDISIAGISLQVTRTLPASVGAMVTIGDGDSTAICRVANTARTAEPERFRLDVGGVVGALRNDRGQVIKAWHRPN